MMLAQRWLAAHPMVLVTLLLHPTGSPAARAYRAQAQAGSPVFNQVAHVRDYRLALSA